MNMNNVVISAALTGGGHIKSKGGQGYRPITPEAIAADVVACAKAGAAICHIHTRDENGKGTMDLARTTLVYETIQAAVKEAGVDVIINLTTSGGSNEYFHNPYPDVEGELTSVLGTILNVLDDIIM